MNKVELVLKHLERYGSITSWRAIKSYRVTRLSSIIFNLKRKGYDIRTIMMDSDSEYSSRYAKYVMLKENRNGKKL